MNRRSFLAAGSASTLFGVSGCIDTLEGTGNGDGKNGTDTENEWPPEVTEDEPELESGAGTTLQIEANPVSGVRVSPLGDTGLTMGDDATVELDLGNVTKSPLPDAQQDSYPPTWLWDSQTSVEVEVSVQIADDVEAGEYPYEVNVKEKTHSGRPESFEFTMLVVEN